MNLMSFKESRGNLLLALRRVLRPLTRLMIRVGIRFPEFDAITKEVFIESAIRDLNHHVLPSRERIAVLAGLTRCAVNDYIDGGERSLAMDPTVRGLLVEVLHKWHTAPGYVGPYGIPLELEFETPANRCIRSLVSLVSHKIKPQVILEELLRSGAVLRSGGSRFRATSRTFMMPDPTSPALIEAFGMTVSRLGTTLEYNMDPKHLNKRLERRVFASRGVPETLLPAFEDYARTKASEFLLELDNWLASHSKEDSREPDGDRKVDTGVNVFLYVSGAPERS